MSALGSIFDIFRVGHGPSSTHSIGPYRAARLFVARLKQPVDAIRVTLYGSLAALGRGHMTDHSIAAGLEGRKHSIVWDSTTTKLPHPNTMLFEALDQDGNVRESWRVYSVGGGNLKDDNGPVAQHTDIVYPVSNITEALRYCEENGLCFWQLVEQYEKNLWEELDRIWTVMCTSIENGLTSEQIVLPGTLGVRRRARTCQARARMLESPERDVALLAAFALAVAEENADGGIVVTAPSCGASGVVPALLYYFQTVRGVPRREILQALATAGLFGAAIRTNASISGAEVGCQGEIGSACSMAAAAASQLLGGTLYQIEYAAEVGMEHHLGLTCDPVEGYVQVPCIERNMAACLRAIECGTFSLLTDGRHLISFDDVIAVMAATGHDLQRAYRETGQGGLALLWQKRTGRKSRKQKVQC